MISQRGNAKAEDIYAKSYATEREVSEANESFSSKQLEVKNSENAKLERLAASFLEILGNINSGRLSRKWQEQKIQESEDKESVERKKRSQSKKERIG